jgi:prolyl-tRNA synthetase
MTLTSDLLPRISTVLDSSLSSSSSLYAVHPSTSDSTIFLSGTDLAKFLISLAHKDNSNAIKLVDFAALKSATPAGAAKPEKKVAKDPSKTAMLDKKRKEEAKIEGAAEVAIGIRKDGDFPEWYKRVLVKGEMIE